MNYWKPNGNFSVADCMPFFHQGVFHLYYLLDVGHHHHPYVGAPGGFEYAHASSTDLIHWRHHPLALTLDFQAGECSNLTGSMLEYRGRIYAFYALRSQYFSGEQLRVAVSDDDGMSFQKCENPQLEVSSMRFGHFRDPKAFVGDDGLIHVLVSAGSMLGQGMSGVRMGEIAHYTTEDMVHFQECKPFLRTWEIPECCDYFFWNDRYYYTYNQNWENHARHGEHAFGPWQIPDQDIPASRFCCVMKTAPWKDNRRIGVGWIPAWKNGPLFGGRVVFRELIQQPDYSLGTAFVEEMIPQENRRLLEDVELQGKPGLDLRQLGMFPDEFRLDGVVEIEPGTREFGLALVSREQYQKRLLSFEPEQGMVELDGSTRLKQVDMSEGKVSFRLIRSNDVLDLEVDGNRTLVGAHDYFPEGRVVVYVRDGKVSFQKLKIYGN